MTETMNPTVSLRDAAAQLGVSPRTMRRYVRQGGVDASLVVGRNGPEYRLDAETVAQLAGSRGQGGQATRGQVVGPVTDTVAMTLASRIEQDVAALERAWSRVADLERENAELRGQLAQLTAGSTTMQGTPVNDAGTVNPNLPLLVRVRRRLGV